MGLIEQVLINWDRAAFLWVNHDLKCGFLDAVMPHISDVGLGHVQVTLILLVALILGILAGEVHFRSLFRDVLGTISKRRNWVGPLLVAFAISGLGATA